MSFALTNPEYFDAVAAMLDLPTDASGWDDDRYVVRQRAARWRLTRDSIPLWVLTCTGSVEYQIDPGTYAGTDLEGALYVLWRPDQERMADQFPPPWVLPSPRTGWGWALVSQSGYATHSGDLAFDGLPIACLAPASAVGAAVRTFIQRARVGQSGLGNTTTRP
jgi:hypothetical protein